VDVLLGQAASLAVAGLYVPLLPVGFAQTCTQGPSTYTGPTYIQFMPHLCLCLSIPVLQVFPVDVLREAAGLGLAGLYVPEEYGGSGLGRLDGCVIFEGLAYGDISTAAFLTIHNMVRAGGVCPLRQCWPQVLLPLKPSHPSTHVKFKPHFPAG
jgi:hypothetical protein